MGSQQFRLRWNNHQVNMLTVFEHLLSIEALVDVTLVCEGLSLKAHKMVLSACSDFFTEIFMDNPCKHPIVILKDMRNAELNAIIDFMYRGEVSVSRDELPALLKAAETLKVKGLTEVPESKAPGNVSDFVQDSILKQAFHKTSQDNTSGIIKEERLEVNPKDGENSVSDKSGATDTVPKFQKGNNEVISAIQTELQNSGSSKMTSETIHGNPEIVRTSIYSQEVSDIDMNESTSEDDGDYRVIDASNLMEQTLLTNESTPDSSSAPRFEIVPVSFASKTSGLVEAPPSQIQGFEISHTNPKSVHLPVSEVKQLLTFTKPAKITPGISGLQTVKTEPIDISELQSLASQTISQLHYAPPLKKLAFVSNLNFAVNDSPSTVVSDPSMLRARLNIAREQTGFQNAASSSTQSAVPYSRSFHTYATGCSSEFGIDLSSGSKPTKVKKQIKVNRDGIPQPKRASTAYINFTMWYREEVKRSGRPLPRIGVFGKECATKWNAMTEEEKAPFRKKADRDKERYKREMQVYKPARDANKPKRPGTAFMLFMSDFRKVMAGHEPEGGVAALSKLGSEKWRAMTEEEKSTYLKMQYQEKVHYDTAMREYRKACALALVAGSSKDLVNVEDGSDDSFDSTDMNFLPAHHVSQSSNVFLTTSQSTSPQTLPASPGR